MSGDAPITNCTELRIGSLQGRSSLRPCRRHACLYIAATVRLTSPSLGAHTQDIPDVMTGCRQRRFLAEIVTGSHGSHGTARVCHRRRLSRRQPAAARYAHEFRMHCIRQIRRTGRPVGTTWPAGPPCQCDSVTCEHTLYHPKTDGSEGSMAYIACAYSIASAILFQGCLSFAPCTSLQ
jgi:hypothetical protein